MTSDTDFAISCDARDRARETSGEMTLLIAGILVFFGVHSVGIVAPAWRDAMAARLGGGRWQGAYSLVAALGLVLLVIGYGQARAELVVLYVPPAWLRQVTIVGMLAVFPLLLAAYFPGRIRAKLKHPMLVAVKLWATLHLLANGSLADVLLFGAFLLWAVADRISLKRRPPRPAPGLPESRFNDLLAVVLGLAVYAVFVLGGHQWLTGMPVNLGR